MAHPCSLILRDLEGALAQLPLDSVQLAASSIAGHRRIFVYGAGRSGLMLRAFAMRLAQMEYCVYVVGETITPAIGPGDLLVLASASGRTPGVCRYAQTALEAGAELLILSAASESPLADIQKADVLFAAPDKDSGASAQVMGSLFEQMLLLFADAVTAALPCDRQAMRGRHANLE